MIDKKTREILEFLQDKFEQDLDFPTEDKEIARVLNIGVNAVRATLRILSDKKFIDLGDGQEPWVCFINANRIEELDKLESEDKPPTPDTANSNAKKLPTVFISHSILDIDLAKKIKSWLDDVGISIFIAHQDLEPAKDFDLEIIEQIKTSLIFVPLLTKNFMRSEWCDQETGIAIATNSTILPIKIDNDPMDL